MTLNKQHIQVGNQIAVRSRLKYTSHHAITNRPCRVVGITKHLFTVDYGHFKESFRWADVLTGDVKVYECEILH